MLINCRHTPITIVLMGVLLVGIPAASGEPPQQRDDDVVDPADIHHEVPDDRWIAPDTDVDSPPFPTRFVFGDFIHIQVNTDADSLNIPNDAANEPSIAVDPTAPNRMVVGWRQFDNIQSNFRQAGYAYSHDGGRTWTFPGVHEPGIFRSDPVMASDASGVFYYNSLRGDFSTHIFISEDAGVTWDGPFFACGGDKQWFAIDQTEGIGADNIYQTWSIAASCAGSDTFNRSTDGGHSFSTPIMIPSTPFWGILTVDDDGTVFVAGLDANQFEWVISRSTNAQDRNQEPSFETISVDSGGSVAFGAGPNPGGLIGQVYVVTDQSGGPNDGNIYLLSSRDPPGGDPSDVHFARSTDGGDSWSEAIQLNDDAGNNWQWFATMSIAPNGRLDVIWNDTRNAGQDNMSELFYTFSEDGGDTWAVNQQIGPVFNSHIGWPDQNKIGDYYDMKSDRVGADLIYSATYNGEQDVYYVRIGDYDCNDTGVGDNEDLANATSLDCNRNGIPDECEIAAGTVDDKNGDGVPDECGLLGDIDGDGLVGTIDLLMLLGAWGPCDDCATCIEDLDGDCEVGPTDLILLLGNWG